MAKALLEYFGHCAFRWTADQGTRIVVDPFDNDESRPWMRWFARPMPFVSCDYVLVTHEHFDHRAVRCVTAEAVVRDPITLSAPGIRILGVADQHVPGHGSPGMRNVIYVVDAGGVRCCHWGDNRADPPQSVVERLGRVDVLMLPVDDSCHLLQYAEVTATVDRLSPRVVVPMHYVHPSISHEQSPLRGIDDWLKSLPYASRLIGRPMELEPGLLPVERQVWVFEPSSSPAVPLAADD